MRRISFLLAGSTLLLIHSCQTKTMKPTPYAWPQGIAAPMADKNPRTFVQHGDTIVDEYYWMNDYFKNELNIPTYYKPTEFVFNNKTFLIGHGDGLGPGDKGYKRMKKVFTNSFSKWLYRWLHPDLGVKLAQYLSVKNKLISGEEEAVFLGEENEWLALYAKRKLETKHYDFFVFGHRHLSMQIQVGENSTYYNLGDWISQYTYGIFDGASFDIKTFEGE